MTKVIKVKLNAATQKELYIDPNFFCLLDQHPQTQEKKFYEKIAYALLPYFDEFPLYLSKIVPSTNGCYQIILLDLNGSIQVKKFNLSSFAEMSKGSVIRHDIDLSKASISTEEVSPNDMPPLFNVNHPKNKNIFNILENFAHRFQKDKASKDRISSEQIIMPQNNEPPPSLTGNKEVIDINLNAYVKNFPAIDPLLKNISKIESLDQRFEGLKEQIQQLLESAKDDDTLTKHSIDAISNIKELNQASIAIMNLVSEKNIIASSLENDIHPHFKRYQVNHDILTHTKSLLAWTIHEGINNYINAELQAHRPVDRKKQKSINKHFPGFIDIDADGNLSGYDSITHLIMNTSLQNSEDHINKLLAKECNTSWLRSSDKQVHLADQINKASESLQALHGFAPFHAWQKNLLVAKTTAGFQWDNGTKNLAASLLSEKEAVSELLKTRHYQAFCTANFSAEEKLLDAANLALEECRISLPSYRTLFSLQKQVVTIQKKAITLAQDSKIKIESIASHFQMIKKMCIEKEDMQQILLGHKLYSLQSLEISHYLHQCSQQISEKIAVIDAAAKQLSAITVLPQQSTKQKLAILSDKLDTANQALNKICELTNEIHSIEHDITTAYQEADINFKRNYLVNFRMAIENTIRKVDTEYNLDTLRAKLKTCRDGEKARKLLRQYDEAVSNLRAIQFSYSLDQDITDENFLNKLHHAKESASAAFQEVRLHYQALHQYFPDKPSSTEGLAQKPIGQDKPVNFTKEKVSPGFWRGNRNKILAGTALGVACIGTIVALAGLGLITLGIGPAALVGIASVGIAANITAASVGLVAVGLSIFFLGRSYTPKKPSEEKNIQSLNENVDNVSSQHTVSIGLENPGRQSQSQCVDKKFLYAPKAAHPFQFFTQAVESNESGSRCENAPGLRMG